MLIFLIQLWKWGRARSPSAPHSPNCACVKEGASSDLTTPERSAQPTMWQGSPLLAHHRLHLPAPLLRLGELGGVIISQGPWEEEAHPTHRQKRVASDSAPQDWTEGVRIVTLRAFDWTGHHFLGVLSESGSRAQFVDLREESPPTAEGTE